MQSGIYNGYYQITKVLIFPNQKLDGRYHHIFNDYFYEKDLKFFCFYLLDNDFMNINEEKNCWNPSYTITSLLLQVQNFLFT